MSRRVAHVIVLVLAALSASTSGAAAGNGADTKGVGGGWVNNFGSNPKYAHFSFSAHSGPNGDFGQAKFSVTDPVGSLDVTTDVDCLNVFPLLTGYGAWFSGLVTAVDDPSGLHGVGFGDRILYFISDGGNPSTGMVDVFDPHEDPTRAANCKMLWTGDEPPNVTQGNIVITGN